MTGNEDPPRDDRSWWDQWAADAERDLMRVLYGTLSAIAIVIIVAVIMTVLHD